MIAFQHMMGTGFWDLDAAACFGLRTNHMNVTVDYMCRKILATAQECEGRSRR